MLRVTVIDREGAERSVKGESGLLDRSDHRQPTSRLSCEVPFSETLGRPTVSIVRED